MTELQIMMKDYTDEERQEVYDKVESLDNLLKAMVALEENYNDDGSAKIKQRVKQKGVTNGGW